MAQKLDLIDGCIQPFESFAYKIHSDDTKPNPGRTDIVYLNSPWKAETPLKIPMLANELPWGRSEVIGARIQNGTPEIWIENFYYSKTITNDDLYQTFSIYNPGTQQWKYIDVDFNFDKGVYYYISKLFFARDGSIWGLTETRSYLGFDNKPTSILSKYNEKQNKFEFDFNVSSIPMFIDYSSRETIVLFGNSGDFWFIVGGDSIYHYDPSTGKLEKKISVSSLNITSTVISPDNSSIYIMTNASNSLLPESFLYLYSIEGNILDKINVPQQIQFDIHMKMLFDHQGRLWLDSVAWMDADGEWYNVIQPTIFITNYGQALEFRWEQPSLMQVTSDGRLWFVGDNGSTWLDPDRQKWCWFTTQEVIPVDDTTGSLWIVEGEKLFRANTGQE